jgi:hypothetical protein
MTEVGQCRPVSRGERGVFASDDLHVLLRHPAHSISPRARSTRKRGRSRMQKTSRRRSLASLSKT